MAPPGTNPEGFPLIWQPGHLVLPAFPLCIGRKLFQRAGSLIRPVLSYSDLFFPLLQVEAKSSPMRRAVALRPFPVAPSAEPSSDLGRTDSTAW